MVDYTQVLFTNISPEASEIIVALLGDAGFIGFEEFEGEIKAFVDSKSFREDFIQELAISMDLTYSVITVPATNWNEVWESNFQPVIIGNFVGIRAEFHLPIENVKHEIVITPKMSFGTGHHATTSMMILQMEGIDFIGKSVFDFGTGTGILAILAERLGAARIIASDNDEWSIRNAKENFDRNKSSGILLFESDSANMSESFDVILANINKNIILANMETLSRQLSPGGVIVLSGLLAKDEDEIMATASKLKLQIIRRIIDRNWLSLRLSVA
jgi:ribosomal protein L11 methyltransferase